MGGTESQKIYMEEELRTEDAVFTPTIQRAKIKKKIFNKKRNSTETGR